RIAYRGRQRNHSIDRADVQIRELDACVSHVGAEGSDLAKLYDYDIILLDLVLADMSGYEVLRTLRVAKIKTPILVLSGLAEIKDKVKCLALGADDRSEE